MGFRRIRSEADKSMFGSNINVNSDVIDSRIQGLREENFHTTKRIGVGNNAPKPGNEAHTLGDWDEVRFSFHSYCPVDGSFKIFFEELVGDPATASPVDSAWAGTWTEMNFDYSRFKLRKDGVSTSLITTNEFTNGRLHVSDGTYTPSSQEGNTYYTTNAPSLSTGNAGTRLWGEMRVKKPSTAVDGRFWFSYLCPSNVFSTFCITRYQVFKYGALVNEVPLTDVRDPTDVNGLLDNYSPQRRYWVKGARVQTGGHPSGPSSTAGNGSTAGSSGTVQYSTRYGRNQWIIYYPRMYSGWGGSTYLFPQNWSMGPDPNYRFLSGTGPTTEYPAGGNDIYNSNPSSNSYRWSYMIHFHAEDNTAGEPEGAQAFTINSKGTYTNPALTFY